MMRMCLEFARSSFVRGARICVLLCAGCTQGDGDACQIDSDCSSGLVCTRTGGNERGRCQDANTSAATPVDDLDAAVVEPPLPEDLSGLGDAG
jgi:hypothetical protein